MRVGTAAMAVAVGRNVALPGASCGFSTRRFALKDTAATTTTPSLVRVSLPSSSGRRPRSWRISGQTGVRCEARAAKKLFELGTSNALQLHHVEDTSGAVDGGLAVLSEFEELLTQKSQEVAQLNEGTTIFLVGMMASGKSTIGRILADALSYAFFDSDEVIVSYVDDLPVKEIFRQHGEATFRDLETRALQQLSEANSLVVATGGGAVVRNENWTYLRDGIVVWLDVPVDDLAKRVITVKGNQEGTKSRPLLGEDCADFEKAFSKLSKLMDEREQHYARAHCRLSFRDLASSLGLTEVGALTPTTIAVQVLEEIRKILQEEKYIRPPVGY